jgi:photosystem II stability/assembly factor-like uncharacterized protein
MKKIIFILLIVNCSLLYCQSGWFWQNPLPFGNEVGDIYFFNSQTGLLTLSSGSVLKSTNAGINWNVFSNLPGHSLYDLSFFDNTNGIAFSGNVFDPAIYIFNTTNGGANWFNYSVYPYSIRKYFQVVSPSVCYANNDNYVAKMVRSINSGLNWSVIFSDSTFFLNSFHFPSASIGYAAGAQIVDTGVVFEIIKTTNGGSNWVFTHQNITGFPYSIYFLNDNTGYVDMFTSGNQDILYKTTDGGTSWIYIAPILTLNRRLHFINENTGYSDIYNVTTNGGLTWQSMSSVFDHNSPYKLSFAGTNVFGIGTGMITKSTNSGINWSELTYGYHTYFDDVHFINAMTGLVCGEYGKLLRTTNGGMNWNLFIVQAYPESEISSISMPDQSNWYVSEFMTGRVLRTTNAGLSWDTTYTNVYGPTRIKFINAGTGFGICKYNYFIKTTNSGTNWNVTNLLVSQNWALDFYNANTGMIGGSHTLRTTNGGNNWIDMTSQLGIYTADIQFASQNIVYAGGDTNPDGVLLKSTDAGVTWQACTFPEQIYRIMDICFLNPYYGFVSTGAYLYKTTNGGASFVKLNSLGAIVFSFADSLTGYGVGNYGTIIKTTNGGGEPIAVQPISNEVPKRFVMQQNYPNPFNPTTIIKFSVPLNKGGDRGLSVRLSIYDITGREVATLINEQLQPGTYEVLWDGTNYASGVYFYRLEVNAPQEETFIQTTKMVLLK